MTTFPTSDEPPTTPYDVRRWVIVGLLWGVAFLAFVRVVVHLLGLPTE